MENLPFNACDYRCERCLATGHCAVFREISERDARSDARGRATDGFDAALRDVGDIFDEVNDMLAEMAEESGIDLDDRDEAGRRDRYEETKKDPLYLLAFECTAKARSFLKTAESLALLEGRDALEDIRWHHTIVLVKVFRAIRSSGMPEMHFDAVSSSAVAVNSLTICAMAFDALAYVYPMLAEEANRLSSEAEELKRLIRMRFRGTA